MKESLDFVVLVENKGKIQRFDRFWEKKNMNLWYGNSRKHRIVKENSKFEINQSSKQNQANLEL